MTTETTTAKTKGAIASSEKPTPATVHEFARRMKKAAGLPRKLRGGTFAVRHDESLLPKSPAESADGYKLRMSRTFLLGAYEEASDRLKSTVFSGGVALEPPEEETQKQEETGKGQGDEVDPPKVAVDPKVEAWARDFDNEHRTLLDWLMDAFEEGIDCGLVHALADHPVTDQEAETLEDEIRSGARPYAVMLHGDTLIQKVAVRRGSGQLVPLRLNFERVVRETDGYGEVERKIILELHAGDPSIEDTSVGSPRFASWKEFEVDKEGKVSETPLRQGSYRPHVEIPIRTCYFRRTGFLEARPAAQALAEKVAEHLQSSSHQRYNLDFARHPRTFRRGFQDDEKKGQTKTSASAVYSAQAAHSDMKVVETTGAALGAGRQHLEDCKAEIQQLAFKPYVKLTAVTAAEAAITKDDASNLVTAWAYNLEAFAQELLDLFVAWQTPVGKEAKRAALVKVNPDESLVLSPQQIEFLTLLIKDGRIDDETVLKIAKELGTLPEWVDVEVVLERVKTAPPKLVGMPIPFGAPPPAKEEKPGTPPEGDQVEK